MTGSYRRQHDAPVDGYQPGRYEPQLARAARRKVRSVQSRRATRGEPMEAVIDTMRDNINVTVNTSRNDITNGFNISFRYRDPRIAQAITAELASKYINVQTAEHVNSNTAAKKFFDNQVNQAQEALGRRR